MTDAADRLPNAARPVRRASTAGAPAGDSDPPPKHHRRRFLTRFLVVVAAMAGLWLVHGPLLRGLAGLLVVDEPADHFQYVGICGREGEPDGDRCYDAAADLFRQNPSCHILLVRSALTRLVETGVLPSFETLSRRELAARGLPKNAVSSIARDGFDDWATARALRAWLLDRPAASVVLLCGRLRSAHLRHVLNVVLDSSQAARVRLRALRDRRYDETNWWMSRSGYKGFGMEWLRQFGAWCVGGDHQPPPLHTADDYEHSLRLTLSEAAP